MVWARLDDRANSNGKLGALSDGAFRLWACGLIYCQANLTDGFIPEHAIHTFGVRSKPIARITSELTGSLIPGKGPLWHATDGGWLVHDYLDWNDSRQEVLEGREGSRERKERWKERHKNGTGTRSSAVSETVGELVGDPSTPTTTSTSPERAPSAPTRALLSYFDTLHAAKFRAKASFVPGKDAKRIADLWRQRQGDPVTVERLMEAFFASRDPFIRTAGYSVGVFVSQVPKLIGVVQAARHSERVDWREECQRLHGDRCGSATFHAAQMERDREVQPV